nr:germacrene D synthase [Tanacetum cinerariifolium]
MKEFVRSQMTEAKWKNDGYVPTVDEHKSVAFISCGYKMLPIYSFVGMDDTITDDPFKWVLTNPPLIRATCAICRFMDDIVGHEGKTKDTWKSRQDLMDRGLKKSLHLQRRVTSAHHQENIASNSNGTTITRKESRALNANRKSRFNQRKLVFEIDDCAGRINLEEAT